MEFRDVILKRRSIRKFKSVQVEKETLSEIVKYALLAPSGRNSRPVELVLVTNRELISKIKDTRPGAFAFLETAPVCIVVAANSDSSTWQEDASIVATYIQLLAVDYGLGSCWGHAYNRSHEGRAVDLEIKKLVGIPENYNVLCVIGLGYPDEVKEPHKLTEVEERKIHWERW
ncbi:nitroreductase family protein [Fervidobacterium thailandense]|uniref:Nitroreductase n=1 Tax=Fervidobacterium thailandense TaxID=1008305 RepID=A0A1E3G2S9_9BACT|nr:nitroreductase family protein [Fervidobacterium thailandense]ODN30472.1 nitroreductase [Fervidobacterium thailandense]